MKIKFQADANLDPDIWRGPCRREPSIDSEGHMGVIPDGTPDPEVLKLAADAGRVLVSADVKTMPVHFAEYIGERDSPGIILIPSSRSYSSIMEALLLVWLDWTQSNSGIRRCGSRGQAAVSECGLPLLCR